MKHKNPRRHLTGDMDADHMKIMTNPLHSMAEDAFPTLERTIEDSSVPAGPFEVHPSAGAKVADVDSSIDMSSAANT